MTTLMRDEGMEMFTDAFVRNLCLFVVMCSGPMVALPAGAQYLGGAPQRQLTSRPVIDPDSSAVQMLLHAPKPPVLLGPGDSVSVQVFEVDHYDYKTRISSDGTVSLPLVDTVSLQGKTPEEADAAISARLETLGMVMHPHVHVTVAEQPTEVFSVSGEVNKPGTFPGYGSRTLLGAISLAGGLKAEASRNVTLLRPGAAHGYVLNLGADPSTSLTGTVPIYPGDTIVVGDVGVVYVVGAVKNAGVYKLKTSSATTVEQAVSMAGGAGFEAEWKSTQIVRVVDGKRVQIPMNLKRIMNGTAEDPVLQADDIVFIPSNAMRAALKANGAGLAVSLASATLLRY